MKSSLGGDDPGDSVYGTGRERHSAKAETSEKEEVKEQMEEKRNRIRMLIFLKRM